MSSLHRSILQALPFGKALEQSAVSKKQRPRRICLTGLCASLVALCPLVLTSSARASHLLVGSTVNNRVLRYNGTTGGFVSAFVPGGSGGLVFPQGLAIGPDGHLYVKSNGSILRYDGQTGAFLGVFTQSFGNDPSGLYFDFHYNAQTGGFFQTSGPSEPDLSGILFGPDGNLFVSSHLTHSVLVYDGQTGNAVGTFAGSGMTNPTGLTFGPDGNLYVCSYTGNAVYRFHPQTGAFLGAFVAAGSGGLNRPVGLVFSPDGSKLFVSSANTDQVLCYHGSTGAFQSIFASGNGLDGPAGVVFGPDSNLYVSSANTDRVLRFNGSTGAFLNAFVPQGTGGVDGPFFLMFALEPPSSLTANVVSARQIDLAWMDHSPDETGFQIERKTATGSYSRIATVDPGITTFSDATLSPFTTYTYRVRSIHPGGASSFCPAVSAMTHQDPPAAPTDLAAQALSSTALELTWSDNSHDETAFAIFRKTPDSDWSRIAVVGPNTERFVNDGLPSNTTYTYRVRATSNGGASLYTDPATATTLPPAPAAPTNLTATAASPIRVNLTWTDNSNNETAFAIFRKHGSGGFVRVAVVMPNATSYSDTSVSPSSTYTYRIRATHNTGVSGWSNERTVTTPAIPIMAPTNLTATAMSSIRVNLTWTDNSNNETAFSIFRKNGSGDFVRIGVVIPNATSYSDPSASPSSTYTYRIRATNNTHASFWSNEVTVTTPVAPPAAPTGLAAVAVNPTQVNLSWTDNSSNETTFTIFRKMEGGSFARIGVVMANTTSYADRSVSGNNTYTYQIRATTNTDVSGWSNQAMAVVPPLMAPTDLTASAVSGTQVNLSWTDHSDNETAFAIFRKTDSGSYVRVGVVFVNATSFSDTSASPGMTYTYRVRASHNTGVSNWSNEVMVTTP